MQGEFLVWFISGLLIGGVSGGTLVALYLVAKDTDKKEVIKDEEQKV